MQFTLSTVLALALSVSAAKMSMSKAQGICTQGDVACCDSNEVISADGILGGLLAKGALNGLLGNENSACAKIDVLGDVNVLASSEHTETGPVCKSITACCPHGGDKCSAIDPSS
ncbi:hypothetical protein N7457_006625 [Penicillium paradoxum]|uniref:uncharacterized protein n=1 Tax=Penicillium paradoxum TaxID=176176 RepID=UPI00254762F3|nr:uncharacterized protein N7457_006625 [Penicillium paradoxum]KAJ5778905.1 hypothetical protein N7457_006625 [Penicillium paradoxum]